MPKAEQLPSPVYVLANAKKNDIQIIPLSELVAKDEFLHINIVIRDDMMAAHRVPPLKIGLTPSNIGRLDVEKASRSLYEIH